MYHMHTMEMERNNIFTKQNQQLSQKKTPQEKSTVYTYYIYLPGNLRIVFSSRQIPYFLLLFKNTKLEILH